MMWILIAFALSHYGQVQQRQPFPDYSIRLCMRSIRGKTLVLRNLLHVAA